MGRCFITGDVACLGWIRYSVSVYLSELWNYLIVYIFICNSSSYNLCCKNDKWGCLSLIIILMVSCMENQYLPVASNVFVLYFGMYLKNPRMKRIQVGANND